MDEMTIKHDQDQDSRIKIIENDHDHESRSCLMNIKS